MGLFVFGECVLSNKIKMLFWVRWLYFLIFSSLFEASCHFFFGYNVAKSKLNGLEYVTLVKTFASNILPTPHTLFGSQQFMWYCQETMKHRPKIEINHHILHSITILTKFHLDNQISKHLISDYLDII